MFGKSIKKVRDALIQEMGMDLAICRERGSFPAMEMCVLHAIAIANETSSNASEHKEFTDRVVGTAAAGLPNNEVDILQSYINVKVSPVGHINPDALEKRINSWLESIDPTYFSRSQSLRMMARYCQRGWMGSCLSQ